MNTSNSLQLMYLTIYSQLHIHRHTCTNSLLISQVAEMMFHSKSLLLATNIIFH